MNTSNSRREPQHAPRSGREPEELQESCEKKKHPLLRFIGRTIATLLCLGVMAGSLLAVGAVYYWCRPRPMTAICWIWITLS